MEEVIKSIIINRKIEIKSIVNLPKGYDNNGSKKYPLILFLHGAGERGDNIESIKKYGIHKYLDKSNIPAIILSPQCAENSFWDKYIDDLELLIMEITEEYRVDKYKIYLIGISLGAFAAWNFAMQKPDLFSAIVTIAGGAMLPKYAYKMKDIPVWAFHGAEDKEVLPEESIKATNALNEAGGNAKLTIVEDIGHELCTRVFERKELYEWLFKQSKSKFKGVDNMLEIKYHDLNSIENSQLKFAIIMSRYKDKWIFVRHKDRLTWEIPAGHREENEDINFTASRELREETGAKDFKVIPVCIYSALKDEIRTFGQLFYAEIESLDELPDFEIGEIKLFDEIPESLTYPLIQPYLFKKVEEFIKTRRHKNEQKN